MTVFIIIGDMREKLRDIEPDSLDSCVCDPPYHLTSIVKRFGKSNLERDPETLATPIGRQSQNPYKRVAKGFMGQTWDGGDVAFDPATWAEVFRVLKPGAHLVAFSGTRTYHRMVCAIEDAGFEIRDQLAWVYGSGFPKSHNAGGGWGTALKPAWEPIVLARKPLIGTVAANVLQHGTGAINIDGCRIEGAARPYGNPTEAEGYRLHNRAEEWNPGDLGRWPANIMHDGSDEVLAGFPQTESGTIEPHHVRSTETTREIYGQFGVASTVTYGDSGSAARFFYCAKADASERHIGGENKHPTVKPVDLMRWLVRLVTPKGGTVLDPFAGSGSTLLAADREQFSAIGIELSEEYAAIARQRLSGDRGGLLDAMEAA